MATVPGKSHQPLHNFSLPFLKWGQRSHINTSNRCRRFLSDTVSPHRRADSDDLSESDQNTGNNHGNPPPSCDQTAKHIGTTIEDEISYVILDRETNNSKLSGDGAGVGDGDVKPWNLRPRRSAIGDIVGPRVNGVGTVPVQSSMKSGRLLRGAATVTSIEVNEEEDKRKRKLWISLSKEEIEEDIYALTGSKPARRPKKRNKAIQKQIENLYPGLYLVGISGDSYRV